VPATTPTAIGAATSSPCAQQFGGTVFPVTVSFSSAPTPSQIARGVVQASAVTPANLLETGPAIGGGGTQTTSVEMTSVVAISATTVNYVFDGPINALPAPGPAANFLLYDQGAGVQTANTVALGSPSNIVVATFTAVPGNLAGGAVKAGSVFASSSLVANQDTSAAVQTPTGTAGVTTTPDLTSVTIGKDSSGNPTVSYHFNKPYPYANNVSKHDPDFFLYDAKGCLYHPDQSSQCPGGSLSAAGTVDGSSVSSDKQTVTFTSTITCQLGFPVANCPPQFLQNNGFSPQAVKAPVLGAVQDTGFYNSSGSPMSNPQTPNVPEYAQPT
jgi:hypothetical protein